MGEENFYQVDRKAIINLVGRIVKDIEAIHSIKKGFWGKNIRVKQNPEGVDIYVGLIIKRGTFVPAVAQEAQKKIKQETERTLGIQIRKVKIVVKGVKS